MSDHKRKIRKLSEEQYNEYVATLRNDAALYNVDGQMYVPEEIDRPQEEDKTGE